MTEKELRQKVADAITSWVGATKGSTKHKEILAIYNGHKPLARGYTVKTTDAYCATTVSAAYIKAGIAEYTGTECGVEKYVEIAKGLGIWVENDAHKPGIGDACVYDWDDTGKGDCTGYSDHIGIVTKTAASTFVVTEGNMSGGKVGTRTMAVNGKYIRGFICPNFAEIAKKLGRTATGGTKEAKTHTVVAGDTLSKIAAAAGTTVDKLVEVNAIKNKNLIRVGQVIMLEDSVEAAVEKFQYLDLLLKKAAQVIEKAGTRLKTAENGVAALVAAGVINSPDYWLENYKNCPSLDLLLCALGGSV